MTEKRLLKFLPENEKKRLNALKTKPNLDEIYSAELDLNNWQNSIALTDKKIQEKTPVDKQSSNYAKSLPPVRGVAAHDKSTFTDKIPSALVATSTVASSNTNIIDLSSFKNTSLRYPKRFKSHCEEINSLKSNLNFDNLSSVQIEFLAGKDTKKLTKNNQLVIRIHTHICYRTREIKRQRIFQVERT